MIDVENQSAQKYTKNKRNACFCPKWHLDTFFSHLSIILNKIFVAVGRPDGDQYIGIANFDGSGL